MKGKRKKKKGKFCSISGSFAVEKKKSRMKKRSKLKKEGGATKKNKQQKQKEKKGLSELLSGVCRFEKDNKIKIMLVIVIKR